MSEQPALLVRHGSSEWHPPTVSSYGSEAQLRDLLAAQPSLLPGVEAATAVTEFRVPDTGPVDVIAVDTSGGLTLCECKLAANPQIRREVIGQVLAYAAGLWRMPYQEFDRLWKTKTGSSVEESLERIEPDSAESVRQNLEANLASGNFRLVLAVDAITAELKRTVEYLNAHTAPDTSIIALELQYAAEAGVELLVPKIYGSELAHVKRPDTRSSWTEDDLFAAVAELKPDWVERMREFVDHFRPQTMYYYLGTGKSPSMTAVVRAGERRSQPFSIWTGDWVGISANFDWMANLGEHAQRRLYEALKAIPALEPSLNGVEESGFKRRPTFRLEGQLDQPGVFELFTQAFDSAIPPSD